MGQSVCNTAFLSLRLSTTDGTTGTMTANITKSVTTGDYNWDYACSKFVLFTLFQSHTLSNVQKTLILRMFSKNCYIFTLTNYEKKFLSSSTVSRKIVFLYPFDFTKAYFPIIALPYIAIIGSTKFWSFYLSLGVGQTWWDIEFQTLHNEQQHSEIKRNIYSYNKLSNLINDG